MTIKRLILILLTVLALTRVGLSLTSSLSQPQVQGRLELYQTNLVLHASEYQPSEQNPQLSEALDSVWGEQSFEAAAAQYRKIRQQSQVYRNTLQTRLQQSAAQVSTDSNAEAQQLQQELTNINNFIAELDVKQGLIQTAAGNVDKAIDLWQGVVVADSPQWTQLANTLISIWQNNPPPDAASTIEQNLSGWFRYQVLKQLPQTDLKVLEAREQQAARAASIKLAIITGLPIVGGITGVVLLIVLLIQLGLKQEKSILATNNSLGWNTPWDWEVVWQVLIVGFFFVGQFILPFLFGISGFSANDLSIRGKALYVLVTYLLMAGGGLLVLYLSIKSYLPLAEEWFKLKLFGRWPLWGLGGYAVALPAVLLVSLINQQIWQGQGGSNPLLLLALQAQDRVALVIFFLTASIAAPVFEEIMFRGFLLPSLTRYLPVWGSILTSALLFAVAHLSLSEVLPLATLGIILGFVYTRSRNLLAPMLVHCLWNSGTLVSLFILGSGVD